MSVSITLSRIFTIYFLTIAILMIIRPHGFRKQMQGLAEQPAVVTLASTITLILGSTLIVLHNRWNANWTLVITVLAWLTFIKGFSYLLFPDLPKYICSLPTKNHLFDNPCYYYSTGRLPALSCVYNLELLLKP